MAFNAIQNDEQHHIPEDHLDGDIAPFDKLPDDCVLYLFEYLSRKDLLPITVVSQRFHTLAHRSYRVKWANTHVVIKKMPSLRLQLFGSSIRSLGLLFHVNAEVMEVVCELCPNVTELDFTCLSAETFSNYSFHKILAQLKGLSIVKLTDIPDTPKFRKDFKFALQCCQNLTTLRLAPYFNNLLSNFDTLFQVVFPKLVRFEMNLGNSINNASLDQFLRSNSSIKALSVRKDRTDIDLSVILELQTLKELVLITYGDLNLLAPVIPHLYQLTELNDLQLEIRFEKDLVKAFFKSFQRFTNLRKLTLNVFGPGGRTGQVDINDHDLMHLKYLPNLTVFILYTSTNCTYITLPGAMSILKYTPHLTEFRVTGLCQNFDTDGKTLIDVGVYEKLCTAFYEQEYEEEGKYLDNEPETWRMKIFHYHYCKWYRFRYTNLVNLFRKCLEYTSERDLERRDKGLGQADIAI